MVISGVGVALIRAESDGILGLEAQESLEHESLLTPTWNPGLPEVAVGIEACVSSNVFE